MSFKSYENNSYRSEYYTNVHHILFYSKISYHYDNNNIKPKQTSHKFNINKVEDSTKSNKYNLENYCIDRSEHQHQIKNTETQKKKTPISLLNELAMQGDKYGRKITVSYILVAITRNSHKPMFTYMCLLYDKTGNLVFNW